MIEKLNFKNIIILISILLLSALGIYYLVNNNQEDQGRVYLDWNDEVETVYVPSQGGAWYPRMVELQNGDWLLSFDTNEDGNDIEVKVIRSTDRGDTWGEPYTAVQIPGKDVANGQMLQLENGDIWLAYRAVSEAEMGTYETELNVHVSQDNGESWEELENGLIDSDVATDFKGVWEPHLGFVGNEIAVMYAHDGPNEVGYSGQQNLLMRFWEEDSWSDSILVTDGVKNRSRDGMPVWVQMDNGEYIVVYEASNIDGHPFVIKYTTSTDGIEWSDDRNRLFTPDGNVKKAGAPFIEVLENGTLVTAFQTDESSANTGDPYTSMKSVTSLDDGETWEDLYHIFPVPDANEANWNSLMSTEEGELIAATSSNYPDVGIYIKRTITGN